MKSIQRLRLAGIVLLAVLLVGVLAGFKSFQGQRATISDVRLLGVSASVTVKGYFVNGAGRRVGVSFSGTALQADGVNAPRTLATIAGVTLDSEATGAIITYLSGEAYVDSYPAGGTDDFKANYASYPYLRAGKRRITFGRVDTPFVEKEPGGWLPYSNNDLGTTGQVVKSSPGSLYQGSLTNNATSTRYVKFYNKATAPSSADTPVWRIAVPPLSTVPLTLGDGLFFSTAISIRSSTGVADNDNTAPSSNDVVVSLAYE